MTPADHVGDAARLRACAAIVECSRHPTAGKLANFLWNLADRTHTTKEETSSDARDVCSSQQ